MWGNSVTRLKVLLYKNQQHKNFTRRNWRKWRNFTEFGLKMAEKLRSIQVQNLVKLIRSFLYQTIEIFRSLIATKYILAESSYEPSYRKSRQFFQDLGKAPLAKLVIFKPFRWFIRQKYYVPLQFQGYRAHEHFSNEII